MIRLRRLGASAIVIWLLTSSVLAQQSAPPIDVEILNELKQIRLLLERALAGGPEQSANTAVTLPNVDGLAMGRPGASVTVVEFTDLQCPFCRKFHVETFPRFKQEYVDTGRVRFVSKDFPLEDIHPMAFKAAQASKCAQRQGKGWEVRRSILEHNEQLTTTIFRQLAAQQGLAMQPFQECLSDAESFSREIRTDMSIGLAAGVRGTPSIVIGRTSASGIEGRLLVGAVSFDELSKHVDDFLTPAAAR